MTSSKLRFFSFSCMGLALFGFATEIYLHVQGHADSLFHFTLMFLLVGSGMELVRIELERIRKQIGK